MSYFFKCDDNSVPETATGLADAVSDPNYNQLIYEYLTSSEFQEMYSEQVVELESYKEQLQELKTTLEWNVALLLVLVVLFLFQSVRRWSYKLTGGLKDVY